MKVFQRSSIVYWFYLYLHVTVFDYGHCRDITNGDIRDAIMSLVHMVKTVDYKLERHEAREKQLSEWIRKALLGVSNTTNSLEADRGMLSRIDERLANVETFFLKKDERDQEINLKTVETIESIKGGIHSWVSSTMNSMASFGNQPQEYITKQEFALFEKNLLHKIDQRISDCSKTKDTYQSDLIDYMNQKKNSNDMLHDDLAQMLTELKEVKLSIKELWQEQSKTVNINNITTTVTDLIEEKMKLIEEANMNIFQEFRDMQKYTKEAMNYFGEIEFQFNKTLSQFDELSETLLKNMSGNSERLQKEFDLLTNIEQVLIRTADDVLDSKRKIEFGSHKTVMELSEIVKSQTVSLNKTVNDRFNNIETTILNNQSDALSNLTSKLEAEMSQVWRQIGIMYQQVSASNNALDRLQEQTEFYVNGSVSTMDSMTNKVSLITSRMSEVDSNLNYLLGRLSLVTQEFNKIKSGLGAALENIKTSFVTVNKQLKDIGPGPHYISSDETEEKN